MQKVRCALLEGAHGHINVAVTGNKDDGQINAQFLHLVLQFQAAHAGHAHVKNEAAGTLKIVACNKVQGVGVGHDVPAFAFNQKSPGTAHRVVVIDNPDQRLEGFQDNSPANIQKN